MSLNCYHEASLLVSDVRQRQMIDAVASGDDGTFFELLFDTDETFGHEKLLGGVFGFWLWALLVQEGTPKMWHNLKSFGFNATTRAFFPNDHSERLPSNLNDFHYSTVGRLALAFCSSEQFEEFCNNTACDLWQTSISTNINIPMLCEGLLFANDDIYNQLFKHTLSLFEDHDNPSTWRKIDKIFNYFSYRLEINTYNFNNFAPYDDTDKKIQDRMHELFCAMDQIRINDRGSWHKILQDIPKFRLGTLGAYLLYCLNKTPLDQQWVGEEMADLARRGEWNAWAVLSEVAPTAQVFQSAEILIKKMTSYDNILAAIQDIGSDAWFGLMQCLKKEDPVLYQTIPFNIQEAEFSGTAQQREKNILFLASFSLEERKAGVKKKM